MSNDLVNIFRIRKTVFEMLVDRGYLVADKFLYEDRETFASEWKEILERSGGREQLAILVQKINDESDRLIVFFADDDKRVGVRPVRVLADRMEEKSVTKAVLIVRKPLTAFAKSAITELSGKLDIEVFHEAELIVNITKHELVPKHIPLTKSEKENLLARYHINETQLPRIQINDPVARYFGMRKGDVVKIIRPSETAGKYVTYRLCV